VKAAFGTPSRPLWVKPNASWNSSITESPIPPWKFSIGTVTLSWSPWPIPRRTDRLVRWSSPSAK
jgi:hypothetical protein